MIKTISKCRLCDSTNTSIVFDFGITPIANALKNKENLDKPELEFPLRYFKCSECHSVQLCDEVPSEVLFHDYLYEAPRNLVPHFTEMAETTINYFGLSPGSKILDIGSNNGLLLHEYKRLGMNIVGVEPATRIAEQARESGIPTINNFFNVASVSNSILPESAPDLITCTNCFAHVSDLNEFVNALKIAMKKNAYFVFENAYLVNTLRNRDFGQAYFEHFYLHSLVPLQKFFAKHGLELFDVSFNNIQMGSFRGFVRWADNNDLPLNPSVEDAIGREVFYGLKELITYDAFVKDVIVNKLTLTNQLNTIKSQNKSIAVYAWPAKMTLINKYFGLEKYFDYIVDESSVKIGKFAPGTRLEIKGIEFFRNFPPDYCFIGAYNFADDIKNKSQWYKGEWIRPL